jgi:excisionase family DNA binding protein
MTSGATPPRFLQLADVAEILNTSTAQVYALVRRGELPAIKIGGRGQWRVETSELEAFIQRSYEETRSYRPDRPDRDQLRGDPPLLLELDLHEVGPHPTEAHPRRRPRVQMEAEVGAPVCQPVERRAEPEPGHDRPRRLGDRPWRQASGHSHGAQPDEPRPALR